MYSFSPTILSLYSPEKLEPTDDEYELNCELVRTWMDLGRNQELDLRREACQGCPLNDGRWFRGTQTYRWVMEWLMDKEIGIATPRDELTDYQLDAIRFVFSERSRVRSEIATEKRQHGTNNRNV